MKKRSILSMLLVLALLLGLMTGCGGEASTVSEAASTAETSETMQEAASAPVEEEPAPVEEAPVEEEPSAAEEPPAVEVPAEPEEVLPYGTVAVELPIVAEPATYSIWYSEPFTELVDNPAEDVAIFKLLADKTNIQFEFQLSTVDTASEKFQLLFAAEDLPDVITDAMQYYTGSIDDAVLEDEFLYEYSGDLANMSNYSAILDQYIEAKKTITSAETGNMVSFPEIYQDIGDIDGYMIRKDWLDALGMEVPQTYDELHDLLVAMKSEFGGTIELMSSGGDGILGAGFGTNVNLSDEDLGGWYIEDGQVKMGILQEEFRQYIELVKQWYDEGLIYADFVNSDRGDLSGLLTGAYAITVKPPEIFGAAENILGVSMIAMAMPRQNVGDEIHICGESSSCLMDATCWSINADAENIPALLQLIDYMYSEEGYYLVNYGEEGVSYNMVDGEPTFTDLVIANPDGLTYAQSAYLYASSNRTRLPFVSDYDRCFAEYSDAQWDAINIYKDDCDHAGDYPAGAMMTTEQTAEYNTVAADIATYISENVLKFIYGQKDMSEWDSFVETIYEMGIETAIGVKQAAYDDYLAA